MNSIISGVNIDGRWDALELERVYVCVIYSDSNDYSNYVFCPITNWLLPKNNAAISANGHFY